MRKQTSNQQPSNFGRDKQLVSITPLVRSVNEALISLMNHNRGGDGEPCLCKVSVGNLSVVNNQQRGLVETVLHLSFLPDTPYFLKHPL